MSTLQIIVVLFWSIVYAFISYVSITDLIKGRFMEKNGSANILTAIWTPTTILMLIFVSHYAFTH